MSRPLPTRWTRRTNRPNYRYGIGSSARIARRHNDLHFPNATKPQRRRTKEHLELERQGSRISRNVPGRRLYLVRLREIGAALIRERTAICMRCRQRWLLTLVRVQPSRYVSLHVSAQGTERPSALARFTETLGHAYRRGSSRSLHVSCCISCWGR